MIVIKNIEDIKLAEYNPRQLTEKQYNDIKTSLVNFGQVVPLVLNSSKKRKNVLIGGHQRLRVMRDLKFKVVECVELDLTLAKEKELNIRLNKNTGSWDWDVLANNYDVEDLRSYGFESVDFMTPDDIEFTEESLGDLFKKTTIQLKFSEEQYNEVKNIMSKNKKRDYAKDFFNMIKNG